MSAAHLDLGVYGGGTPKRSELLSAVANRNYGRLDAMLGIGEYEEEAKKRIPESKRPKTPQASEFKSAWGFKKPQPEGASSVETLIVHEEPVQPVADASVPTFVQAEDSVSSSPNINNENSLTTPNKEREQPTQGEAKAKKEKAESKKVTFKDFAPSVPKPYLEVSPEHMNPKTILKRETGTTLSAEALSQGQWGESSRNMAVTEAERKRERMERRTSQGYNVLTPRDQMQQGVAGQQTVIKRKGKQNSRFLEKYGLKKYDAVLFMNA